MQRADSLEPDDLRTLLRPPIHPLVSRVDIDEGELIRSGQQGCARSQFIQKLPMHTV
jgi:hypothetical protein